MLATWVPVAPFLSTNALTRARLDPGRRQRNDPCDDTTVTPDSAKSQMDQPVRPAAEIPPSNSPFLEPVGWHTREERSDNGGLVAPVFLLFARGASLCPTIAQPSGSWMNPTRSGRVTGRTHLESLPERRTEGAAKEAEKGVRGRSEERASAQREREREEGKRGQEREHGESAASQRSGAHFGRGRGFRRVQGVDGPAEVHLRGSVVAPDVDAAQSSPMIPSLLPCDARAVC